MSGKFQLQIPEPCHESWEKMSPVEQGRFCNSCQKAVVDFTGMSDTQLIDYFKRPSAGSVCGRFNDDQLERDIRIPGKRMPWLKYFLNFLIPALFISTKAKSQGAPRLTGDTILVETKNDRKARCESSKDEKSELIKLTGVVTNEKGVGLPFASILIKNSNIGASCDSNGYFELKSEFLPKLVLVASCVDYLPAEKEISNVNEEAIEIRLGANPALSEIVVTSFGTVKGRYTSGAYSIIKYSYLQKVKNIFTGDSINVYPNPVTSGSEVKIDLKMKMPGEYNIGFYNIQGQLVKSSSIHVENGRYVFGFPIPAVAPGSYILKVTNKRSGKQHTKKIIVQ
jgi:hypothetical protein